MPTSNEIENIDFINSQESSPPKADQILNEEDLISHFISLIPDERTYSIRGTTRSRKESKEKIEEANKTAEDKIIDAYVKSENAKLAQQKPIAIFVLIIFTIQLFAFNGLMFFIVFRGLRNIEASNFLEIIDFLKYYVGAVVVELIALVTIIVKGSFTLKANSIVEQIMKRKNK